MLTTHNRHFSRVVRYMRPSDYAVLAACTAGAPGAIWALEKGWPTFNTRGTFMRIIRLTGAIGLTAGFLLATTRTSRMPILLSPLPSPPYLALLLTQKPE
jgi:hypothetical protein